MTFGKIDAQLQQQVPVITVDISNQKAPVPSGENYHEVKQNTVDWMAICKHRITGSRLPALLGLYGEDKLRNIGKWQNKD